MQGTKDIGLRGIAVADTKICAVDGERGKLIYRGYDIDELAQYSTFEETVYLLLLEDLPIGRKLRNTSTDCKPELQKQLRIINGLWSNVYSICLPAHIMQNC